MSRLIGPSCAVPSISAGGAVAEPLPSTPTLTPGYRRENASPHLPMMLFMVSEPTADTVPLIFAASPASVIGSYGGSAESTCDAPLAGDGAVAPGSSATSALVAPYATSAAAAMRERRWDVEVMGAPPV